MSTFPHISISTSLSLLFLTYCQLYSLAICCESFPENGQSTPTRICSVNVTVSRKACSLLITEKVLFPYTNSSTNFLRQIPTSSEQTLEDVKATAGGSELEVTRKPRISGIQVLEIQTRTAQKPIEYVLSYTLSDGVMRATTEGCDVIPDDDLPLRGSVWRWATADWEYEISSLQVTFRSVNARRKLTPIGSKFKPEQLPNGWLRFNVTQKTGLAQVYAEEKRRVNSCTSPLQCLRIEGREDEDEGFDFLEWFTGEWWHFVVAGAVLALILSCLLWCICKYCGCFRRDAPIHHTSVIHRSNYEEDEDIDSGLEVPNERHTVAGMDRDEYRARYYVAESERKKREKREAQIKRQKQQEQQQQIQNLQMMHHDQARRREEANRRAQQQRQRQADQRASQQRAAQQRAASQRAAQQRAASQRAAQQRAAAQRAARMRRY